MTNFVKIVEVGPRDGLQNEKKILDLDIKFKFIELLTQTGLSVIEVTSFVKSEAILQMRDAGELFQKVLTLDSKLSYPCLVPNLKGYEQAKKAGVREIALFSATSNSFSQKNVNATVDETFKRINEVSKQAKKDQIKMRAYISTAFGCPYEGEMTFESLEKVVAYFFSIGVYEVSIGDTIGVAHPHQVKDFIKKLSQQFDINKIAMHFHDTRGMAMTNTYVSLEQGIRIFDSSAGGIGGCPYAKGATGNVATEDLWYLFNSLGFETNINFDKLILASEFILTQLNKTNQSRFYHAYKNR